VHRARLRGERRGAAQAQAWLRRTDPKWRTIFGIIGIRPRSKEREADEGEAKEVFVSPENTFGRATPGTIASTNSRGLTLCAWGPSKSEMAAASRLGRVQHGRRCIAADDSANS
jgi:hypothetical protein